MLYIGPDFINKEDNITKVKRKDIIIPDKEASKVFQLEKASLHIPTRNRKQLFRRNKSIGNKNDLSSVVDKS